MSDRAEKYEAFLDDLAPVVDLDPEALERHADFLADDDEARDLRHEASEAAALLRAAGADYVHPPDFEARLLALVDSGSTPSGDGAEAADDSGRKTNPGFAAPDEARVQPELSQPELSQPELSQPEPSQPEVASSSSAGLPPTQAMAIHTPEAPSARTAEKPTAEKPATEKPTTEKKRPMGKLLFFPIAGVLALAAAAAVGLALMSPDDETGPEPTAATAGIEGTLELIDRAADDGRSGVEIQRPGASGFVALGPSDAIEAGSVVRTDERTRARLSLSDGSELVLNHATELALLDDGPRSFRLRDGELVAEVAHLEGGPNAFFQTATGHIEVLGTKFVLTATDDVTSVRVSRGAVAAVGADGARAEVRAGEEGLVRRGAAPNVAPVTDLAGSLAWSELGAAEDAADVDTLAGIGSLRARRPGEREDRERPLTLARHDVKVRIVGNVARTEIEEVFSNDSDQVLEGVYRFPLPPDAQIARLALDVDGRMEEGSFVERDRAAQIWRGVIRNATPVHQRDDSEEFIWVPGPWRDPAILEWQRGGQFELRIFPIPAHGERRVILGYTQTVQPQGNRRRYVYPLAHSGDASTQVGQFDVDVRVAGAEHVVAEGYHFATRADGDATQIDLRESSFAPKGDIVVDYELPGGERDLRWWTYRGEAATPPPEGSRERDREVADIQRRLAEDGRGYVAFALRPELPRATERRARDYVLVVDSSQSMYGERFDRASRLAATLVHEMDRRDRFTLLACDYECRAMPGGMQTPSAQASSSATTWLDEVEPAGASDLVAALREAAVTAAAERRDGRELHVMYVGDGVSSTGYRNAAAIASEMQQLASNEHVALSTVGVGGDADTMVLGAIARAGGGHYVPYVPGQRISVAAMAVLETTYGASLDSPRLTMPDGLSEVAPEALPTIRAGQEVIVVARMDRERVDGDVVLRGTVGGQPYEERYPVQLVPSTAAGNRFVPRLWASGRIEQLQLAGRGEERGRIIAMSKAFGVMSRHTSLLVLESEAMFRAFRVDRNESTVAQWTGDEDAEGGEVDGQLQAQLARGHGSAGYGGLGTMGNTRRRGRSSGPMPAASRAPSARPARMAAMDDMVAGEAFGGGRSGGGGGGGAEASGAAPAEERAEAQRAFWPDMPPPTDQAPATVTAPPQQPIMPNRRPGRWMRRVTVRVGDVSAGGEPTSAERRAADEAEAALRANPDSRDRHRDAVRQLARVGELERALEVADAWIVRDRQDPEALTAKADILGRMGQRDVALRLLTGTVDLSPDSETLHRRLAGAFDRMGRPERACAHRIALAEIDESDAEALADAMRCERSLGREQAAERLLSSVREASVRTRAERVAREEDESRRFRGDFTIEADWSGGDDVDLSILTSQGTRLSWMGGRTTVVGEDATAAGSERLGLRWTGAGTYVVEVSRTNPDDDREIRGRLQIRVLGERQTVPFTLRGGREAVARVRVRRETRLEQVTGTVGR